MGIFIDPSELPEGSYGFCQLLYLVFTYGYVLFKSASLIGDGSELLLLIPALSNIVGSVILPILGKERVKTWDVCFPLVGNITVAELWCG